MVVQRAALIVRIVHAVVVTVAIMVEMMAVNVIRCAAAGFGKIGGDVSLSLYDVLQMGADQRRYAGGLGKDKHCQKPRANAPPDRQ